MILKDYQENEIEKARLDLLLYNVCKKIRSILEEKNIKGFKLRRKRLIQNIIILVLLLIINSNL